MVRYVISILVLIAGGLVVILIMIPLGSLADSALRRMGNSPKKEHHKLGPSKVLKYTIILVMFALFTSSMIYIIPAISLLYVYGLENYRILFRKELLLHEIIMIVSVVAVFWILRSGIAKHIDLMAKSYRMDPPSEAPTIMGRSWRHLKLFLVNVALITVFASIEYGLSSMFK